MLDYLRVFNYLQPNQKQLSKLNFNLKNNFPCFFCRWYPRFSKKQYSRCSLAEQLYKAVIYIFKISAHFLRQNSLFTAFIFSHYFEEDVLSKKLGCR